MRQFAGVITIGSPPGGTSRENGFRMSELHPPFVDDLPVTREAIAYARECHAAQTREVDAAPFILHPLEVAMLLHGRGYDDEVVAAGALHDVLEKTPTTLDEIGARFGSRVASLVSAVSDPPGLEDYRARKVALRDQVARAAPDAQAIYAADKLAKARELRALATRLHTSLDDPALRGRLAHYQSSLEMLERALPGAPLVNQLRFELWAIRQLPPG
jgi:(p)ppGpp synthase/HD superfamily hydrolase